MGLERLLAGDREVGEEMEELPPEIIERPALFGRL